MKSQQAAATATLMDADGKVGRAYGARTTPHMYVVDPMGQWMMRVPANPDPSKLKRDIDRLLRASSSWDLPGR